MCSTTHGCSPSSPECWSNRPKRYLSRVAFGFKYVNMADINSPTARVAEKVDPRAVRPDEVGPPPADRDLVAMVELLFFAYRGFTAEPDQILSDLGFGRAHHRVLHFINRDPGLRVADLLDVLQITKQSLARVLKQLIDEGYVLQARPDSDRRERRLYLSDTGRALAERLLALQTSRLAEALAGAGADARRTAERFLLAVVADGERAQVRERLTRCDAPIAAKTGDDL